MPEGDSLFRTARTLNRALAGHAITRFESVFPHLTRVDADAPLRGRIVERVESRGKHLLIWVSGDLVLRTHMRMNGSWHIYRPGERWFRPRHDMRIVIETAAMHAVAFNVPVAEFATAADVTRSEALRDLGPDVLSPTFPAGEAVGRLESRGEMEIADALLDQTAIAGIGNIYKAEVLFVAKVHPFARVRDLARGDLERIVKVAVTLMSANVREGAAGGIATYGGLRGTTGRLDPSARLWVYGRAGKPCRRCGTPIMRRKQGPHARSTYWCERCQPLTSASPPGPDPGSARRG
jgi:endonuclease-8